MTTIVIDSGVANLASMVACLGMLGAEPRVSADPDDVRSAERLVLPGVGSFSTAMVSLRERGLDRALVEAVEGGTPLLAVCLGLQLLCEGSDEAPGVRGLGVIDGVCRRLPDGVSVPHLGWNAVEPEADRCWLDRGRAAFANSYCLPEAPAGWRTASTVHGESFVSALSRDNVLACQFHPELSGSWGRELLRRWLAGTIANTTAEPGPALTAGLTRRIVPCLDVANGRVVKGVRFQGLRDAGDPAEQAKEYEAQGADEIVFLDITASPEGKGAGLDAISAVRRQLGIPLTVGGGVRTVDDARALLSAGADKVAVNTAAVRDPDLLRRLSETFGQQCIVLAIDARRSESAESAESAESTEKAGWDVLTHGGRRSAGLDAVEWASRGEATGAGEILLTSWDRDGTREGCDLPLLRAAREAVRVPIIASGGVGRREHIADAFGAGADAVLAASIFHDRDDRVDEIKTYLAARGVEVRT